MPEKLKNYFEVDGVIIPVLVLGIDVRPCPYCYRPLSFAHDHYFCRTCPYEEFD